MFIASNGVCFDQVGHKGHLVSHEDLHDRHQRLQRVHDVHRHRLPSALCHNAEKYCCLEI